MSNDNAIEVYYDGNCPICLAEIDELSRGDRDNALSMVNCAAQGFESQSPDGVPKQADLMQALHIRENGEWVSGPAAFARIYERLGMTRMARFWGSRAFKPVVHGIYRLFVITRPLLARLGMARLVRWFVRRELRHTGAAPDAETRP
ncbi:MAG: DUF393 domain-containing protein [Pseudomonadota bacterium]